MTCTEERFLRDVSKHVMTIVRDDGVYRHLQFRKPKPDGNEYWFDLITWPGSLCISGDMGTYVFRRLNDMFEFFRTDQEYAESHGKKLGINLGYWSEKLQAPDSSESKEFNPEHFRANVIEAFETWVTENKPEDDDEFTSLEDRENFEAQKELLREGLDEEVLNRLDDGETRAYDAARNFSCSEAPEFSLDDCWEWDCRSYKFRYVWCCYAIAWGIKNYDEIKSGGKL